jgi:hypothetical protein
MQWSNKETDKDRERIPRAEPICNCKQWFSYVFGEDALEKKNVRLREELEGE